MENIKHQVHREHNNKSRNKKAATKITKISPKLNAIISLNLFVYYFCCINLVKSTTYQYLPRTVSRYDKSKTRTGTPCENYNNYETYGYTVCDENASCTSLTSSSGVQTIGCTCNSGFVGDSGAFSPLFGSGCVDIDECSNGSHDCDENATCTNTEGGFNCTCNQGYYGDGKTFCNEIEDVLAGCEPGYYSTISNSTCRKFFDVDCKSDGTVDIKVYMSYVNNILLHPYNQTINLVDIGFLDPDCTPSFNSSITTNPDNSTEQIYSYNLPLNTCGFRVLRNLQNSDYFDNAIILTSKHFAEQSQVISSKSNSTIFRFQCIYNSTENIQSSQEISHDIDLSIKETGHFQVQLKTYFDKNFTEEIDSNHELFDNTPIYVKIESTESVIELGRELVIESCLINDYEDSFAKLDIELINNFCVSWNHTEIILEEDRSSASFLFYPFLIDDNFEQVFLSCSVYFKETGSGDDVDCTTSTRRKRAVKNELLPSVHEGALNDNFRLQHGPILRQFKLLK